MTIDQLLSELGSRLGIEGLALGDNGTVPLVIDGDLDFTLESTEFGRAMYAYATVGQVPPQNREDFLMRLLTAHCFGAETGEAYFAVIPETQAVVLIRRIEVPNLDVDTLQDLLQEFVNWAGSWRGALADFDPHAEPGSAAAPAIMRV